MSSRNLSQLQFHHYVESRGTHVLEARLPEDHDAPFPSGEMTWHPETGEIHNILVDPERQRRGIATAMWQHAQQFSPPPVHSNVQTSQGKKWAASVGGSYASRYANVED